MTDNLNKKLNEISIAYLISYFFIAIFILFIKSMSAYKYDTLSIFYGFTFAFNVFNLPNIISFRAKSKMLTVELSTIILLVLFSIIGYLFREYALYISFMIFLFNFISFKKNNIFKNISYINIITLTLVFVFIYLWLFSRAYYTPLYLEAFGVERLYQDTLYHTSISNLFSNTFIPSVGLDGNKYLTYHWLAHVLYGGSKYCAGVSDLFFHSIYTIILILPLVFKFIFLIYYRLSQQFAGVKKINLLLPFAISVILFHLITVEVFVSITYVFSILPFIALLSFLINKYPNNKYSNLEIFVLFALLLFILMSKVSTGFFAMGIVVYYIFRQSDSKKLRLILLCFSILTSVFVYWHFLGLRTTAGNVPENSKTILESYIDFWSRSEQFFLTFLSVIPILLILILYKNRRKTFSEFTYDVVNRKYIIYESIFLTVIMTNFIGFYLSKTPADSFFFSSVQHYLFIIIVCVILNKLLYIYLFKTKFVNILMTLIVVLIFISSPRILIDSYKQNSEIITLIKRNAKDQYLIDWLVNEYKTKEKYNNAAIAIVGEKSFKDLFSKNTISNMFIMQSIKGVPLLKSIPEDIYYGSDGYSFNLYSPKAIRSSNINDYIERAKELKYDYLIVYSKEGNSINKKIIKIN